MIIVHGTFIVKPEVQNDALEMMRQMAVASRAERGCITYEFYMGVSDPNTMLLFQEWESVEALQDHLDTEHMEEFVRHLPQILNGEVATRRYEVRVNRDESIGAQDVDAVRPEIETREKIVH
ncbi:MAG: putative quinol monooxygenase [Proteobacteria bacterium]|nr:putative quinol monooxygenase [Pseudomonadota bacterium]MDA1299859.1 putative quinol monooxygenase [Pseudomonadota bacterium]